MIASKSTCHRAFDSLEIRKTVFRLLASDLDNRKASLLACTQVCSSWSDTASDELWKRLGGIKPILNLLGIKEDVDVRLHLVIGSLLTI